MKVSGRISRRGVMVGGIATLVATGLSIDAKPADIAEEAASYIRNRCPGRVVESIDNDIAIKQGDIFRRIGCNLPSIVNAKGALSHMIVLPVGWTMHHHKYDGMKWSEIHDQRKNRRVLLIKNKPALFDTRYSATLSRWKSGRKVYKQNFLIFDSQTETVIFFKHDSGSLAMCEEIADSIERNFIKKRYPEFDDPCAYWS